MSSTQKSIRSCLFLFRCVSLKVCLFVLRLFSPLIERNKLREPLSGKKFALNLCAAPHPDLAIKRGRVGSRDNQIEQPLVHVSHATTFLSHLPHPMMRVMLKEVGCHVGESIASFGDMYENMEFF